MAKQILVPLDLGRNEIRNVSMQVLATAPGAPVEGQFYYDSTMDRPRIYNGTGWVDMVGADGTVTGVSATPPLESSGGTSPSISIPEATAVADGFMSAEYAAKLDSLNETALLDRANHTGTQALTTITGHNKAAHDSLGIDAATVEGASALSLRDRSTHTGTQPLETITGHDKVAHDALGIDAATLGGSTAAQLTAGLATETFVQQEVSALVDAAPGTLDTLNELAAALGDDPNFASTVTTELSLRTKKYSTTVGDGTATNVQVVHNLGTRAVQVSLYRTAAPYDEAECIVEHTDNTSVTLKFGAAPSAGEWTVVVVG